MITKHSKTRIGLLCIGRDCKGLGCRVFGYCEDVATVRLIGFVMNVRALRD